MDSGSVAPLLLFALGGFLIGGVAAFWNKNRTVGVLFAVLSAMAIAGGVLWLIG
ncbi:hypothetical protein [Nakamurella flava]|uniref:hypothetical protein n=1 Tax=Nakamurella flava TaxID=2576308 RepID=UPI001407DD78|nr:hypothetical protein [Nakamurella flava]